MGITSEMQVPSLFLKVKKDMLGGKVQGVGVSQVCREAVVWVTHWVCIPWEYAGPGQAQFRCSDSDPLASWHSGHSVAPLGLFTDKLAQI